MAEYFPPLEIVPIFDELNFVRPETAVTVDFANNNYLRYPTAQGQETLLDVIVDGNMICNDICEFNSDVYIGSNTTPNNTPVLNTYKSTLNLGNAGNGSINVECPLNVGGFGNITMTSSNINLTSGGRLNQSVLTTTSNVLGTTEVLSSYGATATSTLYAQDSSGAQGINFIPNASGGAYNPIISPNDCEIFAKGTSTNTKNLSLTTWASQNTGVKITPTSTTIGAGGFGTAPTTGTTYDGTNITMNSSNPPLSTATQPATTDNSNKMPTTAWVQSVISSLPLGIPPMPYVWFKSVVMNSANADVGSFNIDFSAGGGWGNLQYFTVKFFVETQYQPGSGIANYYNAFSGVMDIYPARVPTVTAPQVCLMSGSINGNGNFAMTDATYAPNGRWYWVYMFQNPTQPYTSNVIPQNIYITSTSLSSITINLTRPLTGGACQYNISGNFEVLQKGQAGQTISTSGLSGNTNINNFYASF